MSLTLPILSLSKGTQIPAPKWSGTDPCIKITLNIYTVSQKTGPLRYFKIISTLNVDDFGTQNVTIPRSHTSVSSFVQHHSYRTVHLIKCKTGCFLCPCLRTTLDGKGRTARPPCGAPPAYCMCLIVEPCVSK